MGTYKIDSIYEKDSEIVVIDNYEVGPDGIIRQGGELAPPTACLNAGFKFLSKIMENIRFIGSLK